MSVKIPWAIGIVADPMIQKCLNSLFSVHFMGNLIAESGIYGYLFVLHLKGYSLIAL